MTDIARDLIDAIDAGDATAVEASFNVAMAAKVAERMDDMRDGLSKSMFNAAQEQDE